MTDPNVEGVEFILLAEVKHEHVLHIACAQLKGQLLGLNAPENLGALVARRRNAEALFYLAHVCSGVCLCLDVCVSVPHESAGSVEERTQHS
jgi:hypothetical protein